MFVFVKRLCILLFWFLQSAIYSHYILETISLWNSHNPVGWITEHLQSFSRLPAYLDLMFAAATSFCGLPRYCTLLFSWKTHTIKLCPLPAGTSKYNCYKGTSLCAMFCRKYCFKFSKIVITCGLCRQSEFLVTKTSYSTDKRRDTSTPLTASWHWGVGWLCKNSSSGTPRLKGVWHSYSTHHQKNICFCLTEKGFATFLIKRSRCVFTASRKWKTQVGWHHSAEGVHWTVCCADIDLHFTGRGDTPCLQADTWVTVI